jgi:hypothetical protein
MGICMTGKVRVAAEEPVKQLCSSMSLENVWTKLVSEKRQALILDFVGLPTIARLPSPMLGQDNRIP